MKGHVYTLLILSSLVSFNMGKTFTRCELAMELLAQGFPAHQLRDWVCLVEAESSRQTEVVGGPDDDGSFDYGLFQINDRYWCNPGELPGKECHIRCKDLLTADISIASDCAKKIFGIQGFSAWLGWTNECRNKKLPTLTECHLLR